MLGKTTTSSSGMSRSSLIGGSSWVVGTKMIATESSPPRVLAVDVGGSHVKALAEGEHEPRRFESGPKLTPREMVDGVLELAKGWAWDAVSVGIPTPVRGG